MAPTLTTAATIYNTQSHQSETKNLNIESIRSEGEKIAMDIVYSYSSFSTSEYTFHRQDLSKHSKTMRRVVSQLIDQYKILLSSMIKKLDFSIGNGCKVFKNVAKEIFADGHYNWGRIVTIYAFTACTVEHCLKYSLNELIPQFAKIIAQLVSEEIATWIFHQGGWEQFEAFFPGPNNFEDKVWNYLLVTAGVFGLGALASLAVAR